MSQPLPLRPNLEFLKKLCKQRVAAARAAGKPGKLTAIQLAVAREYGFASWPKFAEHVEKQRAAITASASKEFAEKVRDFLEACLPPAEDHRAGNLAKAKTILREFPDVVDADILVACALGDEPRLKEWLARDPQLATTPGGPRSWLPLSHLCFSRFLRFEKDRAPGFVKCARLLLAAGADANTSFVNGGDGVSESALYGASGIANNAALTKLLLESGAKVDDGESLYHTAEFSDHACLRLILDARPKPDEVSYCMCHKMDSEDPAGVQLFLEFGADPNFLIARGSFIGLRPLHFAIMRNRSPKVLRVLLTNGAGPNLPDSNGQTPFAMASRLGRAALATLLKKHGATTDLSERQQFLAACSAADSRTARSLLKKHPNWLPLPDQDHRLLVEAAAAGNAQAVALMLQLGFAIETPGDWGGTALHHAAWSGKPAVVKLLLQKNANTAHKQQWGGDALHTAIHGATHGEHSHGVKVVELIAAAMPHSDLTKYLPMAQQLGDPDVIEKLRRIAMARTADIALAQLPAHRRAHKIAGWKPIMDAAFAGDAARIKKLLQAGADPNAVSTTPARYRPLHRIVDFKKTEPRTARHELALQALLDGGADPKIRGGYERLTVLALAAIGETRFVPTLRKLAGELDLFHACVLGDLKRAASLLQKDPAAANAIDENGWTPLHYCANSNMFQLSAQLGDSLVAIARQLLAAGANLAATYQYDGQWPIPVLFGCCGRHDFPAMAELLLQGGANPCDNESVYHAADEGHTAALALIEKYCDRKKLAAECTSHLPTMLHWGHVRGLPWLLAHGGNPNTISDRWGTAALHEAAARGASPQTIVLLLEYGANPKLKAKNGLTALQFAQKAGKTRVALQLER